MKKRKYDLIKQPLLPGFESGRFEPRHSYEHADFATSPEELRKRDTRVFLRVSGEDLRALQRQALAEGLPTQTLMARILHQYARGELNAAPGAETEDEGQASLPLENQPDSTSSRSKP